MPAQGAEPATQLFCMGNPLLDISKTVDAEFLAKYDLKPNDAILAEEGDLRMPIFQELVDSGNVDYVAGGATQNSARVAQALLKTDKAVAYVGCIGNDAYGQQLSTAASSAGVDVQYLVDPVAATGKCAVLITEAGAARSLVTQLAAANNYNIAHAQTTEITARIASAKVFYSAGFFQLVSPDTMLLVAKHAAENNKIFTTNLSAPFLMCVPPLWAAIKATIAYTDILFGNEAEIEEFRNSMVSEAAEGWTAEMTRQDIAQAIAKMPKENSERQRMVVVTQGTPSQLLYLFVCWPQVTQGAGATIVATSGSIQEFPIIPCENLVDTKSHKHPACICLWLYQPMPVFIFCFRLCVFIVLEIRPTLWYSRLCACYCSGAGDAFVGGFLAKLVQGDDSPAACCAAGNYSANVIIQRSGCTYDAETFALP